MAIKDRAAIDRHMDLSVDSAIGAPNVVYTRPLIGPPGKGYMSGDHYDIHFCKDVANTFNQRTGNSLKFPKKWPADHKQNTVEEFIGAASLLAWKQAQ